MYAFAKKHIISLLSDAKSLLKKFQKRFIYFSLLSVINSILNLFWYYMQTWCSTRWNYFLASISLTPHQLCKKMPPALASIKNSFRTYTKIFAHINFIKMMTSAKSYYEKKCHRSKYSFCKNEQKVQRTFWSKVGFSRKFVKKWDFFIFTTVWRIFAKIVKGRLRKVLRHVSGFHLDPWNIFLPDGFQAVL